MENNNKKMFIDKSLGHADLNFPVSLNNYEAINFMSVQSQKVLISAALEGVVVKLQSWFK